MFNSARILFVLDVLAATVSGLQLETLFARDGQTDAICSRETVWMNNAKDWSPCRVAAEVIAPCHGGTWVINALPNATTKYQRPTADQANKCSCSWSAYNLVSACTACQGYVQGVRIWSDYSQDCPTTALSTSFYPDDTIGALPDDISIPAWALINPITLDGLTWNINQARAIHDQGHSDYTKLPPGEPAKKSSSAGAIAGGVIGGVALLAIAATVAFFLLRRHRAQRSKTIVVPSDPYHSSLGPDGFSDKSLSDRFPLHNQNTGTNTIFTSSPSTYPFSVFGGPDMITAPNTQSHGNPHPPSTQSPPPVHSRNTSTGADVITPFSLNPSLNSASTPRKGSRVAAYDSPTALPVRGEDMNLDGTPRNRGRINPPAYTPSPPAGSISRGGRLDHLRNGSFDTSYGSGSAVSGGRGPPGDCPNNSASDIFTSTPMDAMSGVPDGTTGALTEVPDASSYPRDVKRRPTDSIDARDVA